MKKVNYETFEHYLERSLKKPEFRKAWEESETEYLIACQLVEKRLSHKMSQRQLARKTGTTQAVISRIESMNANPSISLLKRLASALNTKLQISFGN